MKSCKCWCFSGPYHALSPLTPPSLFSWKGLSQKKNPCSRKCKKTQKMSSPQIDLGFISSVRTKLSSSAFQSEILLRSSSCFHAMLPWLCMCVINRAMSDTTRWSETSFGLQESLHSYIRTPFPFFFSFLLSVIFTELPKNCAFEFTVILFEALSFHYLLTMYQLFYVYIEPPTYNQIKCQKLC